MPEVWASVAAGVSIAATVAGTAYTLSQGGGPDYPRPKKFVPIDAEAVNKLAKSTDQGSYALSDADYIRRHPELAAGRDYLASHAGDYGTVDKQTNDVLAGAGLNTVSGDPYEEALALGHPVLSLKERGRNTFQQIMGQPIYAQRQFGLTGADAAHIALANTNSANVYNQGVFENRLSNYNNSAVQGGQNLSAGITGLTGAIGLGAGLYNNYQLSQSLGDPSLRVGYYNEFGLDPAKSNYIPPA